MGVTVEVYLVGVSGSNLDGRRFGGRLGEECCLLIVTSLGLAN